MDINNLAPELKALALLRNKEQGKAKVLEAHNSVGALFNWMSTPEGHEFWSQIDKGADVTGWACYPKPIESYQIF